jgi:hypothetical protein
VTAPVPVPAPDPAEQIRACIERLGGTRLIDGLAREFCHALATHLEGVDRHERIWAIGGQFWACAHCGHDYPCPDVAAAADLAAALMEGQ